MCCLRTMINYFDVFDVVDTGVFEQNISSAVKRDYFLSFINAIRKKSKADDFRTVLGHFLESAKDIDILLYFAFWLLINNKDIDSHLLSDDFLNDVYFALKSRINAYDVFSCSSMWFSKFLLQFANIENENSFKLFDLQTESIIDSRVEPLLKELFEKLENEETRLSAVCLFLPVSKDGNEVYIRSDQFDSYAKSVGKPRLFDRKEEILSFIKDTLKRETDITEINVYQLTALKMFYHMIILFILILA